jgi:excisionase family DNA binding protein
VWHFRGLSRETVSSGDAWSGGLGHGQKEDDSNPPIRGERRKETAHGRQKMTTADRIEVIDHPLKAPELARLLNMPLQRVYKLARKHELPSLRWGTSVCFDPQSVADCLRRKEKEPTENEAC